jgi:hypothetical protein
MYSTKYWHISKCFDLFGLILFLLMPYISPVKTQIQLIHILLVGLVLQSIKV